MGRIIFLIVLIVGTLIVFASEHLARFVIRETARTAGLDVRVAGIRAGFFKPVVRIKDLVVLGPEEFPDREMLIVPSVYVRYDPASLFSSHTVIHEARIEIHRIVIVAAPDGKINVSVIARKLNAAGKISIAQHQQNESRPGISAGPESSVRTDDPAPPFVISRLQVKINEVESRRYASGATNPVTLASPIHLVRYFDQVTNLNEVASSLAAEVYLRGDTAIFEPP